MVKTILRESFRKLTKVYDDVRPDYPPKLITDILALSHIPPEGKILEIGTGTGKATAPFAEAGYYITALDPNKKFIEVAKRRLDGFPEVKFLVSSFEQAKLPKNQFDLIIAAQSIHWIRPDFRFTKTGKVLKDGGYLAVFANFQARDAKLEKQVRELYKEYCPNYPRTEFGTLRQIQREFEQSDFFAQVKRRTYRRNIDYTREKYLNYVDSLSWVCTLPQAQRKHFRQELEGLLGNKKNLVIPTETILLMARKK